MNWDQIENRWAAMTRRVRPDWPTAGQKGVVYPKPGGQAAGGDAAQGATGGLTAMRATESTLAQGG